MDYGANLTAYDLDITQPADDRSTLKLLSNLSRMEIFHRPALYDRWIDYTNVDLIFASFADLQEVVALSKTWEAIRRWLAAGGTLCVYDVGADFSRLEPLEQALELMPLAGHQESDVRAWNVPKPADFGEQIRAANSVNWGTRGMGMNVPGRIQAGTVDSGKRSSARTPTDLRPFVWRRTECGHVMALTAENPFPGQPEDWAWLFNSLDERNWMWYRRHGMSQIRKNPEFWNWMVPGVGGGPPVNSFLVLISLFVLVIGPLNYVLLRRYRRLHLLLIFVPLGAGTVTFALFLYALVDDGLSARGRGRV